MALLKNLYLDLGYLNPFKNLGKRNKAQSSQIAAEKPAVYSQPTKKIEIKEVAQVSKNIILGEQKKLVLPKVERKPVEPPKKFDQNQESAQLIPQVPRYQEIKIDAKVPVTFFNSLSSKDLLKNGSLNEMQTFWQEQKSRITNMHLGMKMNEELQKKFDELQELELQWQRMQLEYEKLSDELSSKEMHIENHIRDIKKRFKSMHFHAPTHEHHNFVLCNGQRLRSLNELALALPEMDQDVFLSHSNSQKNDFASWVRGVMNLEELAKKMENASDKQQMLEAINSWKNSH